jgi:hypothetical protein
MSAEWRDDAEDPSVRDRELGGEPSGTLDYPRRTDDGWELEPVPGHPDPYAGAERAGTEWTGTERTGAEWAEAAPDADLAVPDLPVPGLPFTAADLAARTSDNRVDLADDVVPVILTPDYGGYLDLVIHGDAEGTQADLRGRRTNLTLEETATLIERTPTWEQRPVRLLSCSVGKEEYAQRLADRLGVPVYAPSDLLRVEEDGRTAIDADGSWRRFEPGRGRAETEARPARPKRRA